MINERILFWPKYCHSGAPDILFYSANQCLFMFLIYPCPLQLDCFYSYQLPGDKFLSVSLSPKEKYCLYRFCCINGEIKFVRKVGYSIDCLVIKQLKWFFPLCREETKSCWKKHLPLHWHQSCGRLWVMQQLQQLHL